ncbi:hypothetical protein PALU110988_14850 [Paenibacillus lupini]|uniref:hypothetical protein n=1 Tax=Paenibacillus lupini TaxID=1450204 RepID=UPI00141E9D60|nr:hypothetical protein [Paenibacillus lupini]NIK25786.1 hypothetical protein [Paenibacillus lupini]
MLELHELHDLIPYIFSISILCSIAYAAYFAHHSMDTEFNTIQKRIIWEPIVPIVVVIHRLGRIQHWLTRRIKRKEAPDGDSADCNSSFGNAIQHVHKRGGFLWERRTMHSPLFLKNIEF